MKEKYSYLKKYIGHNDLKGTYFLPVPLEDIKKAEKMLGFDFPVQLKEFYAEVGAGILSCGEKYPQMFEDSLSNEILSPTVIAGFYNLATKHHKQSEDKRTSLDVLLDLEKFYSYSSGSRISVDALESWQSGDLPFFEMYDSSHFLVMKPCSDNPNAIWALGIKTIKIEDSFEKFIWRLYYESPSYYGDIIEKYYTSKK
jgi:hypothetical protein